ncbi:unnamed protein product [Protopolystoma xenopodis]|uniref:Uncharacterized protein n=1 Tax=Protopolystoma xenopodis TaxID=117903 RepID=A0A448WGW2_9PLAT|nr:unnamed protein product [Protopolystoma xenopodis]
MLVSPSGPVGLRVRPKVGALIIVGHPVSDLPSGPFKRRDGVGYRPGLAGRVGRGTEGRLATNAPTDGHRVASFPTRIPAQGLIDLHEKYYQIMPNPLHGSGLTAISPRVQTNKHNCPVASNHTETAQCTQLPTYILACAIRANELARRLNSVTHTFTRAPLLTIKLHTPFPPDQKHHETFCQPPRNWTVLTGIS